MSAILEKFIVPSKNEKWRFSGLKPIEVQKPAADVRIISGAVEQVQHYKYIKGLSGLNERFVVEAGARFDLVMTLEAPAENQAFQFIEIEARENSTVNLIILNLSGGYIRQEITAILKSSGANVRLRSLTLAKGNMEIDQRTLQIHEAPHTKSDLLFKNVVSDRARTIFGGVIKVKPVAQGTDAYQKNRNLILGDDAQANSLPGLEIEANDVKCSHGATCGKLNEEELFYLRARGIGQQEAKQMLVGGFCEEIISQLPGEVAEEVRNRLIAAD